MPGEARTKVRPYKSEFRHDLRLASRRLAAVAALGKIRASAIPSSRGFAGATETGFYQGRIREGVSCDDWECVGLESKAGAEFVRVARRAAQ